ncbi:MAG TPA: HAD-IIB family hydrolase [Candidatus Angelobacter sp.]|nr:HAD-IIB family hydrolase [Candidatus Angelobacter sp.]
MRYIALATDYDGTLAHHGTVEERSVQVLERVKASGRKLLLVTGRHLPDLKNVFPRIGLFDYVVVENGALLYCPATRETTLLCEPPPPAFLAELQRRKVPFETGRAIVSTWTPHQNEVLEAIRELALDLQVVFNKGAVMVLPSGVNKATGLHAALEELDLSFHNTVALGDAENDHAFLSAAECGVAVANAVPALLDRADVHTENRNGAGVTEIAEQLLRDDLAQYDDRLRRHSITLGTYRGPAADEDEPEKELRIHAQRNGILIAGPSASGKSTTVAGILEQLAEQKYQFCLIDPEGDYEYFAGALSFGTAKEKPDPEAINKALASPDRSVIVNLMALPVAERPEYFAALLPRILEWRTRTARPHWLVIDEAHHLLPISWTPAATTIPPALKGIMLITVHPEHVSPPILKFIDAAVVTGNSAPETLAAFAKAAGFRVPQTSEKPAETGQALVWFTNSPSATLVNVHASKAERRRHRRNYAEGELSPDQSFYFRGPDLKLNLRAQNLMTFLQIADGVDDETWLYHLGHSDYSHWFEAVIKDSDLARAAKAVEHNGKLSAAESRAKIKNAIESRYTAAV